MKKFIKISSLFRMTVTLLMTIASNFVMARYSARYYEDDDYIYKGGGGSGGGVFLFFAIMHAVPIILAGFATKSRLVTVIVAAVMAVVAVLIGNPTYSVIDLIFVALGTWISLAMCPKKTISPLEIELDNIKKVQEKVAKNKKIEKPHPEKRSSESWIGVLIGLVMLFYFFYGKYDDTKKIEPMINNQSVEKSGASGVKPIKKQKNESDLRYCLNLKSNEEIAKCTMR